MIYAHRCPVCDAANPSTRSKIPDDCSTCGQTFVSLAKLCERKVTRTQAAKATKHGTVGQRIAACLENAERRALSAADIIKATGLTLRQVRNELQRMRDANRVVHNGKRSTASRWRASSGAD